MPILSRGAINDPTNDRQNFSRLTETSPCDNVLLEHSLALEFQHRGLIERIYPVLLGEAYSINGEDGFAHYFNTGCHPDLQGNIVVKSVRDKIDFHLDRLCLGTPLVSDFCVRTVEKEILSNQGKVADGATKPLLAAITKDIREMTVGLRQRLKNVLQLTDELKMLRSQKSADSGMFRSQSSAVSESLFGTPRSQMSRRERSDTVGTQMVDRALQSDPQDEGEDRGEDEATRSQGATETEALLVRDSEERARGVDPAATTTGSGFEDGFGVSADDTEEAISQRSQQPVQSSNYKIVPEG